MGMECSDLSAHAGYNILNLEGRASPAPAAAAALESPDGKMTPEELRRYMDGELGGNKKRKM